MAGPTLFAADFVATLVELRIPLSDIEPEDRQCSICKDNYTEADPADEPVRLTCSHVFGLACLCRWLSEYGDSCPACRRVLHTSDLQTDFEDEAEDWSPYINTLRRIIAEHGPFRDAEDVLWVACLQMVLFYNPQLRKRSRHTYWWDEFTFGLFSEQAQMLTLSHHRYILEKMQWWGAHVEDVDQYLRNLHMSRPEFFPSMRP